MQENESNHGGLERTVERNTEMLEKNNELLRRLERNARWSFWLQAIWYLLLIGLPFALYFYILEPYFAALGSSYETFSIGMQEIPGLKHLNEFFESFMEAE